MTHAKPEGLLTFALICSLLGLLLIIFLANNLEPNISKISEIDERNLDEIVKIQGEIIKTKEYETLTIFTLDDGTGEIDVVYYSTLPFEENDTIEAMGKVVEYKGRIEIEANKIKIVSS